jgi:hypothetical protein
LTSTFFKNHNYLNIKYFLEEILKYEMEQNHYTEMDKIKHENEIEIATIRNEIERIGDMNKQKQREMDIKVDEFQSDLRLKQKQIDKLNDELKELKFLNNTLKEEIECKSKEVKQIRSDVTNEIKCHL